MNKWIFVSGFIGICLTLIPIISQMKARSRMNDFQVHQKINNDIFMKYVRENDVPFKKLSVKMLLNNPDDIAKHYPVWRILERKTRKFLVGGVLPDADVSVFLSPPSSYFSSYPEIRIHRRISEHDPELTERRRVLADLIEKILIERLNFPAATHTTEIYTRSEHEAHTKMANEGLMRATYIDEDGTERLIERFLAPGVPFPGGRPYNPDDDPTGEKIR
jgi:hypothetical protein